MIEMLWSFSRGFRYFTSVSHSKRQFDPKIHFLFLNLEQTEDKAMQNLRNKDFARLTGWNRCDFDGEKMICFPSTSIYLIVYSKSRVNLRCTKLPKKEINFLACALLFKNAFEWTLLTIDYRRQHKQQHPIDNARWKFCLPEWN